MSITIRCLGSNEIHLVDGLLNLFAEAFDDEDAYSSNRPSTAYLKRLLSGDAFIAVVALAGDAVVGGIAAYELPKFEQERSEIYIYDLAVSEAYRRKGIATALIKKLEAVALDRGADVIFVQADTDEDDQPAIELYNKLGRREDVLHFDIPVGKNKDTL